MGTNDYLIDLADLFRHTYEKERFISRYDYKALKYTHRECGKSLQYTTITKEYRWCPKCQTVFLNYEYI